MHSLLEGLSVVQCRSFQRILDYQTRPQMIGSLFSASDSVDVFVLSATRAVRMSLFYFRAVRTVGANKIILGIFPKTSISFSVWGSLVRIDFKA